jgi:hypothetical protein
VTDDNDAKVNRIMNDAGNFLTLGAALRIFRKETLRETTPELARRMDIPWGTYIRIERDESDYRKYLPALRSVGFSVERYLEPQAAHSIPLQEILTQKLVENRQLIDEGQQDIAAMDRITARILKEETNAND